MVVQIRVQVHKTERHDTCKQNVSIAWSHKINNMQVHKTKRHDMCKQNVSIAWSLKINYMQFHKTKRHGASLSCKHNMVALNSMHVHKTKGRYTFLQRGLSPE